MKRGIAALVAAAQLPWAMVPAAHGIEGNQSALERFAAERRGPFRTGGTRRTTRDDAAAIAKLIEDINAAARIDKRRILSIITINTDIAGTTLEQQKSQTGFSLGEVYVTHALALATRKKFNDIAKIKKSGKTWSEIARQHNVTLSGSQDILRQIKQKS